MMIPIMNLVSDVSELVLNIIGSRMLALIVMRSKNLGIPMHVSWWTVMSGV